MNTQEHLLTCLAEECNEVAHRVSKALRFGLDEVQEGQTKNNAARIAEELTDLLGVLKMLEDDNVLFVDRSFAAYKRKKDRVLKYMERAVANGVLQR